MEKIVTRKVVLSKVERIINENGLKFNGNALIRAALYRILRP